MSTTITGGSLTTNETKKALLHFGLNNITARDKYKTIAQKLNIIPYKKTKSGQTDKKIKVGTATYKKEVEAEVLRRYNAYKEHEALLKQMAEIIRKTPAERKIKTNIHKMKPRIVETELIKKIGNYNKYFYRADNINNLTDLYEVINTADEALGGGSYATLILLSNIGEKPRRISIAQSYLNTYQDFEDRINQIFKGNLEGSDAVDENLYTLVLDTFHLSRIPIVSSRGESDGIIFKCHNIVSKDGYCGYECLKLCGFDFDNEEKVFKKKDLRDVRDLIKVIKKHKLKIEIVCNGIRLKKTIGEIINGEEKKTTKERLSIEYKKRKNELRIVNKLLNDEYSLEYYNIHGEALKTDDPFVEGEDEPIFKETHGQSFTIIYDDINKHFDLCVNAEPELKDDLKISLNMELMINDKILMNAKQCNKNVLDRTSNELKYIFFDYETIMDFKMDCCMIPYSLSILVLSLGELEDLEKADREKKEETVKAMRKKGCKTFLGYDCSEQFIKWFIKETNDLTFCFVGFNNANFDNFLLLDGLLNFDMEKHRTEFSITDIFYNGSQLLNFRIDNRHSLFDIRKHLVGSLNANCKAFKINCCAKKSFEHAKAQRLHDNGELINFITGNDELKEYNEYDVLATAVLFKKYQMALLDIPSTAKYADRLKETITIGSLIYEVFTNHTNTMKDENIKYLEYTEKKKNGVLSQQFQKKMETERNKNFFGRLSYQQYKDLQKNKIAGRVELFNGVMEIFERMASTDVCSLYPFVMAVLNVYYPYGDIIDVECYQGDERLGFYYCDIDQSNLRKANKPKIYARKTEIENDWNFSDDTVLDNYLISNVIIGLLLKHGCKVTIRNGFVFQNKAKSCKMFKFILEMMEAKNKQDTYKDSKDPAEAEKYIAPLRETLKLLQNSLSGKVIEGLHTELTRSVDNCSEYEKIRADPNTVAVNFINSVGNKLFITYEVDEEQLCEKKQRPIFLGVLIYDYAKRYMYEYSYSKIGLNSLYYTDTDASKFKYKDMARWREWIEKNNIIVPHWPEVEAVDARYKTHLIYNPHSKVYGSFEDELDGMIGDNYVFYCLEKKSWAYAVLNNDKTIAKSKFKFKGVNGGAIILTGEEEFLEDITTNKKDGTTTTKKKIKCDKQKEVYLYAENNKDKAIENGNEVSFFKQLYNTKEAYLLTNSFRKIVKNSARNVAFGNEDKYNTLMNKIQVNYVMKHIKLHDKNFKKIEEIDEDGEAVIL